MNRKERRIATACARGLSSDANLKFIGELCSKGISRVPSAREMELSRAAASHWLGARWYHGGIAGREPGNFLLPPNQTGQDPRGHGNDVHFRKDFVYITPRRGVARHFSQVCGGSLYLIEPQGEVLAAIQGLRRCLILYEQNKKRGKVRSFEAIIRSVSDFTCASARVLEVLE